jgi:type II secretory pathway pseudopilin PulG
MMLRRVKERLNNEAGNFMVSTLIGSMVMMVVIGAIAAGVLGIALFQKAITEKSDVTKEAAMADSTLRSDVLWASSITATDSKKVELTVPGTNGACRNATWTIGDGEDGKTTVDVTVVSHPSTDSTVNPVRCSGEPSAPSTQTIISDADPASTFTYANAGGRELTFTAGTAAVDGSTDVPAAVPAKTWASTKLAAVALNTAVASSTDRKGGYRFAQTADNLSVVQEPADAPSHFVPEGNLTALP